MKKKARGLITGYLERVASSVFDAYHDEITELVGGNHGVYALYKKDRLYYVGLATNLRTRVKHHLRDQHKQKWDRFSLYLIKDVKHLRELESLIVHVSEPKGNKTRGGFAGSVNLQGSLKSLMVESSRRSIEEIFGKKRALKTKLKKVGRGRAKAVGPVLKGVFPSGTKLRTIYHGKTYKATVDSQGRIRRGQHLFNSPSMAGHSVTNRPTNGWRFWKAKSKDGEWVQIRKLARH